jgi:hypothetical protein
MVEICRMATQLKQAIPCATHIQLTADDFREIRKYEPYKRMPEPITFGGLRVIVDDNWSK